MFDISVQTKVFSLEINWKLIAISIFMSKNIFFLLSFAGNSFEKLFFVMNFKSLISCLHKKSKKDANVVAGAVSLSRPPMFVTTPGTAWPTAGAAVTTSVTRQGRPRL